MRAVYPPSALKNHVGAIKLTNTKITVFITRSLSLSAAHTHSLRMQGCENTKIALPTHRIANDVLSVTVKFKYRDTLTKWLGKNEIDFSFSNKIDNKYYYY